MEIIRLKTLMDVLLNKLDEDDEDQAAEEEEKANK